LLSSFSQTYFQLLFLVWGGGLGAALLLFLAELFLTQQRIAAIMQTYAQYK
jgi:hypothetical protein